MPGPGFSTVNAISLRGLRRPLPMGSPRVPSGRLVNATLYDVVPASRWTRQAVLGKLTTLGAMAAVCRAGFTLKDVPYEITRRPILEFHKTPTPLAENGPSLRVGQRGDAVPSLKIPRKGQPVRQLDGGNRAPAGKSGTGFHHEAGRYGTPVAPALDPRLPLRNDPPTGPSPARNLWRPNDVTE